LTNFIAENLEYVIENPFIYKVLYFLD